VDSQCGKLVIVIGHQFITLNVDVCVQHVEREALRRAGLSAAVETLVYSRMDKKSVVIGCDLWNIEKCCLLSNDKQTFAYLK